MQVEVNETNIDKFGLVALTENSREELLSHAAEASTHGFALTVEVPDDHLIELNIFDVVEGQPVENPENLGKCRYANRWNNKVGESVMVCIVHDQPSKYTVVSGDSTLPCLAVEPHSIPKFDKEAGSSCIYTNVAGSRELICVIHGEGSKYDVRHHPGMPCKKIDPVQENEDKRM